MYSYEELKHFVEHCSRCPLSATRNKSVMGRGNFHSSVMFIAEAPGYQEDRDGIPFTGPSGKIFDELLASVGMGRDEIYLTNVVKCHPPRNRDPEPDEQEACIPYLKYETLLIRPKVIVCLGRIAAQRIIRPDFRITREHGQFLYRKNTWLTAVYHPSAILRDDTKMAETKEDFKAIREKLCTERIFERI
ncbi:uracil-DNA glycosylase [Qiania dongpingensis]|uniref:Type-4 uracil-DNA glycosylase n=1 Tax=Qiania dongpingensis TaxID=2763669 RepID=A0A7G9G682_9FIRM|nr:uracil-DNA glycosylase [Qiania dongpingensis]QNM06314.1 uracil-DNA glycosylase [Qiania dongpingensis]